MPKVLTLNKDYYASYENVRNLRSWVSK